MKRIAAASLALACVLVAARQETTDAVKFRYAFKEGQKLSLNYGFEMSAKIDEIPPALEGMLDENALNVTFEGLMKVEVKKVMEGGEARLEGRWRTAKVKGNIGFEVVDIDFDAGKDKPGKLRAGMSDFGTDQDHILEMLRNPQTIEATPRGNFSFGGESLPLAAELFLSLNGLMGAFPEEPVGRGKSWKGAERELRTAVSSLPFKMKVHSENTYAADEKLGGRDCVRIDSKFTVTTDQDDAGGGAMGFSMKGRGEGEGRAWFCVREGLPASTSQSLTVKAEIGFVPPGDGEEVKIKATLKTLQGYELEADAD